MDGEQVSRRGRSRRAHADARSRPSVDATVVGCDSHDRRPDDHVRHRTTGVRVVRNAHRRPRPRGGLCWVGHRGGFRRPRGRREGSAHCEHADAEHAPTLRDRERRGAAGRRAGRRRHPGQCGAARQRPDAVLSDRHGRADLLAGAAGWGHDPRDDRVNGTRASRRHPPRGRDWSRDSRRPTCGRRCPV